MAIKIERVEAGSEAEALGLAARRRAAEPWTRTS